MRLAALIIRYWSNHTEEIDQLFETTDWNLRNIFPKLKWCLLYLISMGIARTYGYSTCYEKAFLDRVFKKER